RSSSTPHLHSFPTRRSSDLDEECERLRNLEAAPLRRQCARFVLDHSQAIAAARPEIPEDLNDRAADIWEPLRSSGISGRAAAIADRKSTRLNSSHVSISYAV